MTTAARVQRILHGQVLLARLLWPPHAELMAAGGGYAQLYALQARGYA